MPSAWTVLKSHSTLPSGSAWQHLNATVAGTVVIAAARQVDSRRTTHATRTLANRSAEILTVLSVDLPRARDAAARQTLEAATCR